MTLAEERRAACQVYQRWQSLSMPIAKTKRRSVKSEAIRLVRDMPASSSWDDVMYRIYVRQKIEAGVADLRAGRVHSHDAVRKEFVLS